jgi:hypothetical protein
MSVELCAGCGAEGNHPYVGVYLDEESGRMESAPICAACNRDPSRAGRPMKFHYFPRDLADQAVVAAEKSKNRPEGSDIDLG